MHTFNNAACLLWEYIIGKCFTLAQCMDLEEINKKEYLWVNNDGSLSFIPWVLSKQEKEMVKRSIEGFKTPKRKMQSWKDCFLLDDNLIGLKTRGGYRKMLQV